MYLTLILFSLGFFVSSWGYSVNYCDPKMCEKEEVKIHSGCPDTKTEVKPLEFNEHCLKLSPKWIPLTTEDKAYILKLHNELRNYVACGGLRSMGLRSACRMGVVQYDEHLEETATFHVQNCTTHHDGCRTTQNYNNVGQNIGRTRTTVAHNSTFLINKFVFEWFMEYKKAKQANLDLYSKDIKDIDYFTVLQKEEANRVGCALATWTKIKKGVSKTTFMLTCNYAMTNLNSHPVYNSCKEPAAGCAKKDETYPYLCSKEEVYDYNTGLVPKKYDGDDTEPTDSCGDAPEGMATKKPVSSPGGNKPSAGGHSSKPGYRKGGRREGCSGGIREGVRVVSIDDDEYFDYAMGPYPGFSSTLSQRQRINKLVLSFAITITVISHILQN